MPPMNPTSKVVIAGSAVVILIALACLFGAIRTLSSGCPPGTGCRQMDLHLGMALGLWLLSAFAGIVGQRLLAAGGHRKAGRISMFILAPAQALMAFWLYFGPKPIISRDWTIPASFYVLLCCISAANCYPLVLSYYLDKRGRSD